MESNAIQIVVRVRPWHPEKELPLVHQPTNDRLFLGDGGFASSPRKPTASGALRCVVDVNDDRMLHFDKASEEDIRRRGIRGAGVRRNKDKRYIFDRVLGMHTTQAEVFEATALKLLGGVLNGYNATVFAYGATGCGKTHTISGSPEDPGIIIRTMRELYRLIDEDKAEYETFVELSMVEIYNETIRDLLTDDPAPVGGLRLMENEKERVSIANVTLHRPQSAEEVMALVQSGNQRRSTSFTQSNSVSSRSHAVLQINVGRNVRDHEVDAEQGEVKQNTTSATLSIIDLAGSERAAATSNMGARMKEGANINKSLLSLGSCITALCQRPGPSGAKPHVPYRNSKLTRLLKFSLGGNCRTVMVVCVSPSSRDIEDTHNTLTWADRAKKVTTKVSQNTMTVDSRVGAWVQTIAQQNELIKELREEIKRIKEGNQLFANNKRELQWKDATKAIANLKAQVSGMVGAVMDGATKRAEWDSVAVTINVLEKQMAEAEQDVRDFLEDVKREQVSRFESDPAFAHVLSKENTTRETITSLVAALEKRDFGDALSHGDRSVITLTADAQRTDLELRTLRIREQVYSQQLQKQAVALTLAASAMHNLSASIAVQSARAFSAATSSAPPATVQSIAEALQTIGDVGNTALSALFGQGDATSLMSVLSPPSRKMRPPVSSPLVMPSVAVSAPAAKRTSMAAAPAAGSRPQARPRSSLAPGNISTTSFTAKSAFLASPAARRLVPPNTAPVHAPSPRKAAIRLATGYKKGGSGSTPRKAAKSLRFKGDASIDEIQTFEVLTSQSESSPGDGMDADDSWSSEPTDESEIADTLPELPKPRMMALPGRAARASLSAAPIPRTATAGARASAPTTAPSGARPEAVSAPVPSTNDWRQNRAMMKAAADAARSGGLSAIGEENVSMTLPAAAAQGKRTSLAMGAIGLGAPVRPAPLGERRDNTSAGPPPPGAPASIPLSGFQRPTAASVSKSHNATEASNLGSGIPRSSPNGAATSAAPGGRRVSSIGPLRPGKDRSHRVSAIERKASVSNLSEGFVPLSAAPVAAASASSGGARRPGDISLSGSPPAATAGAAPHTLSKRMSMSNLSGSVSSRMSMGGMPAAQRSSSTLAGRPSISRLAGSGDTSLRAWR